MASGCIVQIPLGTQDATPGEVSCGFSDVYLQVVDSAGLFLFRVYIPGDGYGHWATRLLLGGVLNMGAYDSLFEAYDDIYDKARVALCRLRFPYELSADWKQTYEQFLLRHARFTGQKLALEDNLEMLTFLLGAVAIPLKKYKDLVEWSAKTGRVEVTSIYLEYQHRTWQDTMQNFSLDAVVVEGEDEDRLQSEQELEDHNIPF